MSRRTRGAVPRRRRTVRIVVKIGTSSVSDARGAIDTAAVGKLCDEVAALVRRGHEVVVVSSGAVGAGVFARGGPEGRPTDPITLQALAAIGQPRLMHAYSEAFARHGLLAGQVLLAPLDFAHRQQYLHARATFDRLLELGVVPVVNENDTVADDEIRFGDNDRLAALVAHLVDAELLVLLTDTAGLFSADPRRDASARLVEEVVEVDDALERAAGGPGHPGGSGGMASKLAAARIAAWSGVRAVIAAASRPDVLAEVVTGRAGSGTVFLPRERRLSARKLWIAFALPARGRVQVDGGARRALVEQGTSLLSAGVVAVDGDFSPDDAVEIVGPDDAIFAKGIARLPSARAAEWMGRRSDEVPEELGGTVVHRDDLVVF